MQGSIRLNSRRLSRDNVIESNIRRRVASSCKHYPVFYELRVTIIMFKQLLSALGGKSAAKKESGRRQATGIDYKGIEIIAAPEAVNGQFRVSGILRKRVGDDIQHELPFERSDVLPSHDAAVEMTQQKAQRFIDDMGGKPFD